jgi:nitrite reductase/ring-hydroxylating ferredoxin subunit
VSTLLARVEDVPDGGALVVASEGGALILTRRGERVFAFRNRCPHAGYPLQRADGRILVQEQRYLVCGAHGASFDLETGACAGGPCNGAPLERVAVSVVGEDMIALA